MKGIALPVIGARHGSRQRALKTSVSISTDKE
jgi:hypothetical protein